MRSLNNKKIFRKIPFPDTSKEDPISWLHKNSKNFYEETGLGAKKALFLKENFNPKNPVMYK